MKRVFEEKEEVVRKIERTICDICGDVVMDNKVFIRLFATDDNRPTSYDDMLDICTPACLEKNIKGIRCVFDGKMVPAADTGIRKEKYYDDCKAEAAPSMKSKIIIPISIGK
jgi:hypothetical protein